MSVNSLTIEKQTTKFSSANFQKKLSPSYIILILGEERCRKKPWVTKDVLDLCDERRDLKKKQYEAEGAKEYREANRRVQKAVKKAKEDWIGAQCKEIETCLNKNNSKRAYQLVKDLTSEKQGRSSTIQDKSHGDEPYRILVVQTGVYLCISESIRDACGF